MTEDPRIAKARARVRDLWAEYYAANARHGNVPSAEADQIADRLAEAQADLDRLEGRT